MKLVHLLDFILPIIRLWGKGGRQEGIVTVEQALDQFQFVFHKYHSDTPIWNIFPPKQCLPIFVVFRCHTCRITVLTLYLLIDMKLDHMKVQGA